jgi:hypothetical protein
MRKYVFALMLAAAAGSTLLIAAFATAGSGSHSIKAHEGLGGYQEVPALSTTGNGTFEANVSNDGSSFDWTLSFSDLEGNVTQAHIHFGQRSVSGGISIWLCGTAASPGPAGTQTCPSSGTVSGTATAANVVGPTGQGIEAGAWEEILAAIRAGKAYANVHSTKWPPGEIRGQLNDQNAK